MQRCRHRLPSRRSHAGARVACTTAATAPGTQPLKAIIVGGGVGGLVAAAKLRQQGLQVTLLEQNARAGGRCTSQHVTLPQGTFRFDTGPSLVLFPHVYRQTFESLGISPEEVPLQRVDPSAYTVWFDGGSQLRLWYDVPRMLQQFESVEPGAGRQYLAWLASARTALEVGVREFIDRDFDSLLDMVDLRRLLPLIGQVDPLELLGQHHGRLAARFKDPRLQALLSFQDLYVGLTPYTAPGVFSLLAATEITDGVAYPIGGFEKVVDALWSAAQRLGVEVRTSTRVSAITTASGSGGPASAQGATTQQPRRVTGVRLASGEVLPADIVVSNRDVPLTYQLLQDTPYGAAEHARLSAKAYSAGVIAYNWCLKRRLDRLAHHNVFMSGQYERSWARATGPATLLPRPNFYVHCPARSDGSAAPQGCDSVMVLLPVANLQEMNAAGEEGDYAQLVHAGRAAIARAFAADGVCDDLLGEVIHEFVIDPVEWRARYGIKHGAVFGLAHGLDQLAHFRPPLRDPKVRGLYLVGASTRPGNGVPLVMISAGLVAQRVAQDVAAGCF